MLPIYIYIYIYTKPAITVYAIYIYIYIWSKNHPTYDKGYQNVHILFSYDTSGSYLKII